MIFWIMTALTFAAMIGAGVLASKTSTYRRYGDGEDIAIPVFFAWLVAFVVSWIVIGIAAASLSSGSKAEWVQTSKWEARIADGTTPEWDSEDGEFEFYVNDKGVLREIELYGPVSTIAGGDGRTVSVTEQRQELGTSVFPWGQGNVSRTVTLK